MMPRILRGQDQPYGISKLEPFVQILLREILLRGDSLAMIFPDLNKKIGFREVVMKAISFAKYLIERNINERDVVVTICNPCPEFPPVLLGTLLNGSILCPQIPTFPESEILHLSKLAKPKLILVQIDYVEKVKRAFSGFKDLQHIETLQELTEATSTDLEHLLNLPCCQSLRGIPLLLIPTFGPKGTYTLVLHTSSTISAYHMVLVPHAVNLSHEETALKITHYSCAQGILSNISSLFFGYRLILFPVFHTADVLNAIQKYKVTRLVMPAQAAIEFADFPFLKNHDISSVTSLIVTDEVMSPEEQQLVGKKTGIPIIRMYGKTECLLVAATGPETPLGSVGTLLPGVEAKVCDIETSVLLDPNVPGELLIRSPMLSPGYYEDTAATAQLMVEQGWMLTGDVAYYDEKENIYIVKRLQGVITYKSYKET